MRWDELSWSDLAALRADGMDLAILPVGATEQHGHHLPTGVDSLSATAVAEGVSAEIGVPVLPTLPYGCSLGHSRKWPGTLSLRPATLSLAVAEIADWVLASGFSRLLILNGHVTNWAPLRCALETIRADLPDMRIALRNIWQISGDVDALYSYDGGTNWHANDAETSLMLHLRPELVDMKKAVDEPDRSTCCFFSYTVDKESETGVTGLAARGDADFGKRVLSTAVNALSAQLRAALTERTPLEDWTPQAAVFERPV
ncbi:creatininase [Terrihabitans soli]|uniref:Creatininase n=1 Tax=Terrihabitans soli TaxID=708113 RepID=A0A6S6QZ08_9HYPH|nr:creatininase [Terrihabitans soli]